MPESTEINQLNIQGARLIQSISNNLFVFFGLILIFGLLWTGAAIRIRHDRKLKKRATAPRRTVSRSGQDRRWSAKRLKK